MGFADAGQRRASGIEGATVCSTCNTSNTAFGTPIRRRTEPDAIPSPAAAQGLHDVFVCGSANIAFVFRPLRLSASRRRQAPRWPAKSLSIVIGYSRTRMPVALYTALETA